MINFSARDRHLTFNVQVVPKASRSEVVGEHDGALRVRIAAPPVDGAANYELIRMLAKTFKVPRSAIQILSGHSGRRKQIRIDGLPATALEAFQQKEA